MEKHLLDWVEHMRDCGGANDNRNAIQLLEYIADLEAEIDKKDARYKAHIEDLITTYNLPGYRAY